MTFEHLRTYGGDPETSVTQPGKIRPWNDLKTVKSTSSGGGRGGSSSGNGTSTTTWKPTGDMPTVEAGTFVAPEFDDKKVGALSQRFAAPNIRKLRNQVQAALSAPQDNPNVGKMTTRAALAGYGEGLESVTAGSYKQALEKYNQEYSRDYNEMMTNFQAQETARGATFEAAMTGWLKGGETKTSRTSAPAELSTEANAEYEKAKRDMKDLANTGYSWR